MVADAEAAALGLGAQWLWAEPVAQMMAGYHGHEGGVVAGNRQSVVVEGVLD